MSSVDKIVSLNCQKFEVDGHWRAVAVTESGERYEGKGWDEKEAKDDAVAGWRKASMMQTVKRDDLKKKDREMQAAIFSDKLDAAINFFEVDQATTTSLASKLNEQIAAMNELIEQAKTEGLDGRLIAMANTDFERGFMALEKALNINNKGEVNA